MNLPDPPMAAQPRDPQPDKKGKKGLGGGIVVLAFGLGIIGSFFYVLSGAPAREAAISPFDKAAEGIAVSLEAENEAMFDAAIKAAENVTGCKPIAGARKEVDPEDSADVSLEATERERYVTAAHKAGYKTGHAVIPSTDGQVLHQVVVFDC